jgi:hypothetical protein
MTRLKAILEMVPWPVAIVLCLTLGLAPFLPEPHIVEKLRLLAEGRLSRLIDIFDLLMHALPFVLVAAKLAATRSKA